MQKTQNDAQKTRLLIIAYISFIALGIAGGLLNIAWTYMQDSFGVELDALGVLLFCGTLGSLLAAFSSGTLIGRYRVGLVLMGGTLLTAFGLLGYALAPAWIILLMVAFFMATGKGTLDAGMNNFVSANYGTSAMNWLHASWGVGLTVAPYVVTFIVINLALSWRVAYVVGATGMLLIALIVFVTRSGWRLDNDTEQDEFGNEVKRKNVPALQSVKEPIVFISIVFFFIYGGVEIGIGQLANTLLVESRNIPQETSSTWVSIYWGTFTLGRMLIGVMALRLSDKVIMWGSMTLVLIGTLLLVWNDFPEMSLMGLMSAGFGLAAMFPILIAQTPGRVGRNHAANAIGFQVGFAGFGGAVVPGVISFFAARSGLESISTLLLFTAVLMVLLYQLMMMRDMKEKRVVAI